MKRFSKIMGVLLALMIAFLIWYKFTFSMDVIESKEINSSTATQKILIASQGSDYKNEIVEGVIAGLSGHDIYIKVIDVTTIESITVDNWNAILILHTFEIWKPQEDAKKFLDKHYDPSKIIVLATSGSGDLMIDGVDGISGASIMENVPEKVALVLEKVNSILDVSQFNEND